MVLAAAAGDLELVRRIHNAVEQHPHVRPHQLRYEATAGRVLIRGRVSSFFEKQMAQEALRSIYGITAIDNELEVCW